MTQQEAIAKAQALNASGTLGWKIGHVAMDDDGTWYGYGEKPITCYSDGAWEPLSRSRVVVLWQNPQVWDESLAEVPQ